MSIKSFMENVFSDNSVVDNCNVNPDVPSVFGADKPTVLELLGKLMRWKVGSVNGVQPDESGNVNVEVVAVKPLTFTGAVTATFDGSQPVTVDIPDVSGNVTSVNDIQPDEFGNVELNAGDVGGVSRDEYERDLNQFAEAVQHLNSDKYGTTNPPPYPVRSVNGKTGTVTLAATDVGAPTTTQFQNLRGEVSGISIDLEGKYSANNPPPYPVNSVNGKTGTVSLMAADVGAIKVGGKAVVFGDSYFDGGTVYNFASYLRSLGIYSDVTDYAKGGTGFGNTGNPGASGNNIVDILANSAVRTAVQQADVIYIHAGGNDLIGGLYTHTTETVDSLKQTVKSCFDTIYALNPDATVVYSEPVTPSMFGYDIAEAIKSAVGSDDIVPFLRGVMAIEEAIASSQCNAVYAEMGEFIKNRLSDNVHPDAYSAHCAFRNVVYGEREPGTLVRTIYVELDGNLTPTTQSSNDVSAIASAGYIRTPLVVVSTPVAIIVQRSFILADTASMFIPFGTSFFVVSLHIHGISVTTSALLDSDPNNWNFTAEQQSTAQQKLGILSSEGVRF